MQTIPAPKTDVTLADYIGFVERQLDATQRETSRLVRAQGSRVNGIGSDRTTVRCTA